MFVDRAVREGELAFLNAPFDPDGWQSALRLLSHATGSAVSQLCGGGVGSGLSFNLFSEDRHDPRGHLVNPQLYGPENWRINCSIGGARSIQFERHYAAYRSANSTAFYDDAVSDLDLPFGCQSPLMLDSNGLVGLALLRSARDGACSPEIIDIFARLARQAHRAVRVEIALGQSRGEDMLSSMASRSEMTLLLDRQGRLVALTEAAETMFDRPAGLRLDGLAVHLADPGEDRLLRGAMARLLAGDALGGPVIHECCAGRSADRPGGLWRLYLTRLPADRDLLGVEARLALTLRPLPGP